MTFFQKKGSLKFKLFLPFLLIILFIGGVSVFLSIFLTSKVLVSRSFNDLRQDLGFMQTRFSDLISSQKQLAQLIPSIGSKSLSSFVQNNPNSSLFLAQNFDFKLYQSSELSLPEQKANFSILNSETSLTLSPSRWYLRYQKLELQAISSTFTPSSIPRRAIVTELVIDDAFMEYVKGNLASDIALFSFSATASGEQPQASLLAASSGIYSYPLLQTQLGVFLQNSLSSSQPLSQQTLHVYDQSFYVYFIPFDAFKGTYFMVTQPSVNFLYLSLKIAGIIIGVLFLLGLLVSFVYIIIIRNITSSLDVLSTVAEQVADGDLSQQVYLHSNDEVGHLASIFNHMIGKLNDSGQKILAEKNHLAALLSCLPVGVIATDQNNQLILANPMAETILDLSSDTGNDALVLEKLQHVLDRRKPTFKKPLFREFTISNSNHPEKTYSLVSSITESNDESRTITVIRDISRDKEIEQLRDGFLRTVSHELRTPLTSVIGYIELSLSQSDTNQKTQTFLKTSLNEAQNLKRLIDDLLDLTRMNAGRMTLDLSPVCLKSFIDNLIITFEPIAKQKDIQLICTLQEKGLKLTCDENKLRRILINLISNAIKFTTEGAVTISCQSTNDLIQLSVQDTGIGLLDEEKDIIFEKFRQIDYSSTREYEGVGVGLAIVKELVTLHQGEIHVDSTYKKGSTFTVSIPMTLKAPTEQAILT